MRSVGEAGRLAFRPHPPNGKFPLENGFSLLYHGISDTEEGRTDMSEQEEEKKQGKHTVEIDKLEKELKQFEEEREKEKKKGEDLIEKIQKKIEGQ